MKFFVNGKEVPVAWLARRGPTNFGQHLPGASVAVPYQITLSTDEFLQHMAPVYQQYATEERADAPFHNRGEAPVLDRWQDLDYPPLEQLLTREPRVIEGLTKDVFCQEILDRVIPGPKTGLPRYLINSTTRVAIDDGTVCLEGEAYLHPALSTAS